MIVHPSIGQRVMLWYAAKWQAFGAQCHGMTGAVEIRAKGPGPRNHGVRLDNGRLVIVPCGNLKGAQRD